MIAGLLILGLVAWLLAVRAMRGMTMGVRYELGAPTFLGVWVLMMAAMMFPSVWPAMVVHERLHDARAKRGRVEPGRGAAFISGYLLSWTAYGVVAFAVVASFETRFRRVRRRCGPLCGGAVAIARGGYQAVPLKRRHLRRCRTPMFWMAERWREGVGGSASDGCGPRRVLCWQFLAFDGVDGRGRCDERGVDSLVAIAIALEKLLPVHPWVASSVIAAGFLVVALVAIADPSLLPGFEREPSNVDVSEGSVRSRPTEWYMEGEYIKACNCNAGCPCDFNQAPTNPNARA